MRKCRSCKERIPKVSDCSDTYQANGFCNVECLVMHSRSKRVLAEKKPRPKKDTSQDLPKQLELTQSVFNKFIRTLDAGKACISCGKYKCGSYVDAGHKRSVGSAPHLRFDPRNCYAQGSGCNRSHMLHDRRGGLKRTEIVANKYDLRLRGIMGNDLVDWLDSQNEPAHYTVSELKRWRKILAAETRVIEKTGEPTRDWRDIDIDIKSMIGA